MVSTPMRFEENIDIEYPASKGHTYRPDVEGETPPEGVGVAA